jgi:hypothetical protein
MRMLRQRAGGVVPYTAHESSPCTCTTPTAHTNGAWVRSVTRGPSIHDPSSVPAGSIGPLLSKAAPVSSVATVLAATD